MRGVRGNSELLNSQSITECAIGIEERNIQNLKWNLDTATQLLDLTGKMKNIPFSVKPQQSPSGKGKEPEAGERKSDTGRSFHIPAPMVHPAQASTFDDLIPKLLPEVFGSHDTHDCRFHNICQLLLKHKFHEAMKSEFRGMLYSILGIFP